MEVEMNVEATAGRPADIQLPEPRTTGGMPLMDAIKARHMHQEVQPTPLSLQELSDVLWAAFGLTREYAGTGIHTTGSHAAPAAHNWQEVDLYVAVADGLYRYDPLETSAGGRARAKTSAISRPTRSSLSCSRCR